VPAEATCVVLDVSFETLDAKEVANPPEVRYHFRKAAQSEDPTTTSASSTSG
jgi:hypothetical protein